MARPEVIGTRTIAEGHTFRIEELELEFSSGERRVYERLPAVGRQAVMVVALDGAEVILIREYQAGFHEYQLTLPRGSAVGSETLIQAANRELKEETGLGAEQIELLKRLNLAPSHMGFTINVMLARGLFDERLPASEPEVPEVVRWPLADIAALLARDDFCEARAIAALCLAQQHLDLEQPRA